MMIRRIQSETAQKNPFISDVLFVSLEARQEFLNIMRNKVEEGDTSQVIESFMEVIKQEAGSSKLDKKATEYLDNIKRKLQGLLVQNDGVMNTAEGKTLNEKEQLIQDLAKHIGRGSIESVAALAWHVEAAATIVHADRLGRDFDHLLIDEKRKGLEKDEKERARAYEVKDGKNARTIILDAAKIRWADQLRGPNVKAILASSEGTALLEKKKQEFDRYIWELVDSETCGTWSLMRVVESKSLTLEEAEEIAGKIRLFDSLEDDEEVKKLAKSEGVPSQSITEQDFQKLVTQANVKEFASKLLVGGSAWAELRYEGGPESAGKNMLAQIEIIRAQEEIAKTLGKGFTFCKVGEFIFASDGKKWKKAAVQELEKPEGKEYDMTKIFGDSSQAEYLEELKKAESMNEEVIGDIEAIMNNEEELIRRIGERVTVEKNFGPFDRTILRSWGFGNPPRKEIQEELLGAVGQSVDDMVNSYKLNFISKNIIDRAKKAKMDAITEAFKNTDMGAAIDGIDEECRELSQAADNPKEYVPYEKFKIEIKPTGIRVIPDGDIRKEHASILTGASIDSVRENIRKKMEIENNPLFKIPLIGPLLAPFLSDLDPGTMKIIASVAAFFGIKMGKEKDISKEEIDKKAKEQVREIMGKCTTLFPPLAKQDFEHEVKQGGIKSRKTGVKSVMLSEDSGKITGTLVIPPGGVLRSVKQLKAKVLVVDTDKANQSLEAVKNAPTQVRENFYAPEGKTLLVYIENSVLQQYSNLPVGLTIPDAKFERIQEAATE